MPVYARSNNVDEALSRFAAAVYRRCRPRYPYADAHEEPVLDNETGLFPFPRRTTRNDQTIPSEVGSRRRGFVAS